MPLQIKRNGQNASVSALSEAGDSYDQMKRAKNTVVRPVSTGIPIEGSAENEAMSAARGAENTAPSPVPPKNGRIQVKSTGQIQALLARILLYGATKVGKTTAAITLVPPEELAIISTQPEEQFAHLISQNIPFIRVRTGEEFFDVVRRPRKLFGPSFKCLVIDDLSEGVQSLVEGHSTGRDNRQAYREASSEMRQILDYLLDQDFHLVITAFERIWEDPNSGGTAVGENNKSQDLNPYWLRPDLPPSITNLVTSKFDFIFHIGKNHRLLTRHDLKQQIIAGNRLPKNKVDAFAVREEPNLARLWSIYQKVIHG